MLKVPSELMNRFNRVLQEKVIPVHDRNHYGKWLRYYLVFCSKYHLPDKDQKGLPKFIRKLQEKHQSEEQQKQAIASAPSLRAGTF